MKNISDNIADLENIKKEVNEHCMCANFEEDETHYRVLFPPGFYPDGVQADKSIGKTKALRKMLDFMEKTWRESYPAGRPPE